MSTGILAMANVHGRKPTVSMLVLKVNGDFKKKAVARTTFTCEQGTAIKEAVERAVASKQPTSLSLISIGRNDAGEVIAEFSIDWSFKARS